MPKEETATAIPFANERAAKVADGGTGPYPILAPLRVTVDFTLEDWAIVPDRSAGEKNEPLDLITTGRYVIISSTGPEVCVEPHYRISAWDDFYVDGGANVRVIGLGGLFPITLGQQEVLLDGVLAILRDSSRVLLRDRDPASAHTIDTIVATIEVRRAARRA